MARYLWGIGQLINDPSSHLVDAFKRHVLDSEPSPVTTTDADTEANESSCSRTNKPTDLIPIPDNASCKINASCAKTSQTKYIQAGNGIIAGRRQVSIQCPSSFYKKISRPTSVQRMQLVDRQTDALPVAAKKDAVTNPGVRKVCSKHRHVYATLKQWPAIKITINDSNRPSKITELKEKLWKALDFFSWTKIPSLPNEYQNRNNQSIRLYRTASIEEINFDEVLTLRHRNYRNKATSYE